MQAITGEILMAAARDGYENVPHLVGDNLVHPVSVNRPGQKIVGKSFTGGSRPVNEADPYTRTGAEDFVTTSEAKKGRIVSLTEEDILFDEIGSVVERVRNLGKQTRLERERTIVRGVTDADGASYRPKGVAETLYNVDGSNRNYIGVGNTTSASFNSAVPLVDWTDIDEVRQYMATQVPDGVNEDGQLDAVGPADLLVPEAISGTASYVANSTEISRDGERGANPATGWLDRVFASPFLDEVNTDDWYHGRFRGQFAWTEIWPLQVFTRGRDSEAAFKADVALQIKVRYYGGISARDTKFVTKIDGL